MENNTSVTIRNVEFFLKGYKKIMLSRYEKANGGIIVARNIENLIGEPLKNIVSIELEKVSPRKWHVTHIMTKEDSFNTEDDDIYISSNNYNLKRITEQIELYQYNFLFGIRKEIVCKKEVEEYSDSFKVVNENDEEITQEELQIIYLSKRRKTWKNSHHIL